MSGTSDYYLRFKSLYEGDATGKMYADISKAAQAASEAKKQTEAWDRAVSDMARNHGVKTSDIIRQLRNVKQEAANATQEYSRLDSALGRVGARLGGAAVGQLTGIPGAGFIGSQLGYSLGLTGGAALGLAGVGLGVFGAAEIARHIGTLAEWAQKQENLSREIGVTVGQMQQLSRISEATGVSVDSAAKSVSKLQEALIQGGSRSRQVTGALSQLGLGTDVAFQNPAQALDRIVEAGAKIADQSTRIAIFRELLGDAGVQLAALAGRWDELKSKQKIISDDNLKNLADARERMKELGESWDLLLSKAAKPANFVLQLINGEGFRNFINSGDRGLNVPGAMGAYAEGSRNMLNQGPYQSRVEAQAQAARASRAEQIDRSTTIGRFGKDIPEIESEKTTLRSKFVSGEISEGEYAAKISALNLQRNSIERQGPIENLTKSSQDALSTSLKGIARGTIFEPRVAYQGIVQKLNTDRAAELALSPAYRDEINRDYNLKQIAAFNQMQEDTRVAFSRFGEGAPDVADRMEEGLRKNVYINGEPVPLDKVLGTITGSGRRQPGLLNLQEPLPIGPSPQEQLTSARNTASRLQALIPLQSQLSGAGGLSTISAEYSERIHSATLLYEAERRLAETKATDAEKEQARQDALDKLKQSRYDADLDREKSLLQLAIEAKSQFASGFAETILAAQSGQGARGLKGFFQGQEATILRNIGGLIFSQIHLPHTKGGTLGDILKGTVFGDRDDNIKKIGADTTRAADDLDQILAILTGQYKNGDVYIPGVGNGRVQLPPNIQLPSSGAGNAMSTLAQISQILYGGGNGTSGGYSPSVIMQGFPGSGGIGGIGNGGIFQNAANWNGGSWGGSPIGVLLSGGNSGDPNVSNVSAMAKAGIQVAAAGIGAWQGISNISRGGGRNTAGGIGELLGAAGMLVPGPIGLGLMGAGLVAGLVSSLFPDPRVERAANINRRMFTQQYLAPPSMNLSVGSNGGYADVSATGDVRSSNFSPYPIVQDPYLVNPHRIVVPGGVVSTYGGFRSGTGTYTTSTQNPSTINVTVQAMDSKSFIDNAGHIVDAINFHINHSDSGLMKTLNQRFQGRNN